MNYIFLYYDIIMSYIFKIKSLMLGEMELKFHNYFQIIQKEYTKYVLSRK